MHVSSRENIISWRVSQSQNEENRLYSLEKPTEISKRENKTSKHVKDNYIKQTRNILIKLRRIQENVLNDLDSFINKNIKRLSKGI